MRTQIMVTLFKLRQSKAMWFTAIVMVLVAFWQAWGIISHDGGSYTGEYFLLMSLGFPGQMLIPVLFVTYFISGDFTNRTICNEISVGYSRASAVFVRMLVAVPFGAATLLLMMAVGVAVFGIINGFDFNSAWHEYLLLIGLYYVTSLALLCLAAFGSFLIRNTSVAMAVNVVLSMIIFGSNAATMDNVVLRYTVFNRIWVNELNQTGRDVVITLISALVTILLAFAASQIFFRRAEIK